MNAIEQSNISAKPAYKYIRESDRLPTIADILDVENPTARVKLFNPCGAETWYIAAYDASTRTAFALVDADFLEAGDVSMQELVELKLRFGLRVERDLHFKAKSFDEIRAAKAPR